MLLFTFTVLTATNPVIPGALPYVLLKDLAEIIPVAESELESNILQGHLRIGEKCPDLVQFHLHNIREEVRACLFLEEAGQIFLADMEGVSQYGESQLFHIVLPDVSKDVIDQLIACRQSLFFGRASSSSLFSREVPSITGIFMSVMISSGFSR